MLYKRLTSSKAPNGGYHIEVLTKPYSCANVDGSLYAAFLVLDIEDYMTEKEMALIRHDVEYNKMSLIVVADWYNQDKIDLMSQYNVVAFEEWVPFMGGSNVPTLNALL